MINFKISELIYSDIASKNKIDNMPDINSLDNLLNLIVCCLQPIRELIKKPILITSGYRSKKLNEVVGGKFNSLHLFGCAADFMVVGLKPSKIISLIESSDIDFDQLINEHEKWVHVSYVKEHNRKQILYIK